LDREKIDQFKKKCDWIKKTNNEFRDQIEYKTLIRDITLTHDTMLDWHKHFLIKRN